MKFYYEFQISLSDSYEYTHGLCDRNVILVKKF